MKTDSTNVRKILADMWPDLLAILVDSDFITPKVDEVISMFNASKLHEMQFIPQFNDCDNYALNFLSQTRIKRYKMFIEGNLPKGDVSLDFGHCYMYRG